MTYNYQPEHLLERMITQKVITYRAGNVMKLDYSVYSELIKLLILDFNKKQTSFLA